MFTKQTNLQTVQIGSLIREVIQGYQNTVKVQGLALDGEYEKDLPALMADPVLLVRVLKNLLDNAIQFAKSRITVKARRIDSNLQISVINDGPGIRSEDILTLFDKFVQVGRPLES